LANCHLAEWRLYECRGTKASPSNIFAFASGFRKKDILAKIFAACAIKLFSIRI
jgi:hypothetical protein